MHILGTSPTHNPQGQGPVPTSQTSRISESKAKTSPHPFLPQSPFIPSGDLGSPLSAQKAGSLRLKQEPP